ncbi:MAG TPA: nuclear transport factor 2 family protein [Polyangiaceae bacterium]|nr:nuclear transport factor 2 family protein [Polyangiaceae bacterium]
MGSAEDEATRVIYEFYDALDELLRSRGTSAMNEIWHHTDYATASHPFGSWARGWTEVSVNWDEAAAVFGFYKGHATRSDEIGGIHELKVVVMGDAAYGTGIYKSKLYMSDRELTLSINCTNIAQRIDGVWKIVHHHADQAPPDWQAAIGRMVEAGHS